MDAPHQHTVLLVEDDSAVREMALTFLRAEGFQVIPAEDDLEALSVIDQRGESLCSVLLDIMLPQSSGLDILRELRGRSSTVTVIAMSANRQALADAVLAGAAVAVAKPFDIEELLSMLARYCAKQRH